MWLGLVLDDSASCLDFLQNGKKHETVRERKYTIKCNTLLNEKIFQFLLNVKDAILIRRQRGIPATQ